MEQSPGGTAFSIFSLARITIPIWARAGAAVVLYDKERDFSVRYTI